MKKIHLLITNFYLINYYYVNCITLISLVSCSPLWTGVKDLHTSLVCLWSTVTLICDNTCMNFVNVMNPVAKGSQSDINSSLSSFNSFIGSIYPIVFANSFGLKSPSSSTSRLLNICLVFAKKFSCWLKKKS